ncbi:MAG: phosphoenolpyruvate--protein phosphotransferase [Candidatus Kapabacteria bacterium]|nr:phosphoenolpyruvate--protein phosphotransferase [Candidatus Kapabacteria bacterium]MBP7093309.1 phosphoenolpyruvate--protein phosphotransferase [Candidatus Kapabacteria bacterium]
MTTFTPTGTRILKGIPASPGIAVGKAFVLSIESPSVQPDTLEQHEIPHEVARFRTAQEATTVELLNSIELARQESSTVKSIIESYLLIASDPVMTGSIVDRIMAGTPAETAVLNEFDVHKTVLYGARDPLLRERVQDFEHVMERIIAALRNRTLAHDQAGDSVVVAGSITPQDMLFFKKLRTLGYVSEVGGINSHSCILARDFGVPAVIGIRNATDVITSDNIVIVDGYAGIVIVDPDTETLNEYIKKHRQAEDYRDRLGGLVNKPTVTTDGVALVLKANVDTPEQVDAAIMAGCEGVGLVRTEMLLVQRGRYPAVDEQTEWYGDIAQRAYPLSVTFRAFDVGSDKFREGIPHHEENPALGLRGIRFLLYRPDIFEDQICAILRASVHRNVRLMLPMISTLEELDQAKAMIEHCKTKLAHEGVDFDHAMPLGVMVETPAAALMASVYAARVDFLSIGTNDLAQYTLATDRTNELVADIFDAMHPAVVRLITMTVDAARNAGITVSVCGEMAGHAASTEMLVGMGIHELSVSPPLLLELKHRIRSVSHAECVDLVHRISACTTTTEVYAVLGSLKPWNEGGDGLV